MNKAYLDEKLSKIESQIPYKEKDYNESKLDNKEDLLMERAFSSRRVSRADGGGG